ncbi:hypothetical protein HHL10_20535 [Azohydromonas sp. G-1-1-14]|uniref:Uncharacterized protein n=1 Tax=Azohydromonas caseinilytica TaxID=2728836 RepID=A0A848FEV3_9BURK|nr:hypothetical protein [Azohydromonas caseinilytica]NML17365.1 hypothetical protein [Azohydromonas caseinilytica]
MTCVAVIGGQARRGDLAGKEHPRARASPRAPDLQRRWHAQRPAGALDGAGVLAPLGFIEVHGREVAAVVLQQRIDANGVAAGQVVVVDGVITIYLVVINAVRTGST